ncbi:hypothetical protein [Rhizocola hellebori]|uniref:hypothetical protein n=1 Tax=Rhizocola hellebori TaxID=1392758 RepID=UPI0019446592|nr:hypothetical protein [Rhizocola hellebori]
MKSQRLLLPFAAQDCTVHRVRDCFNANGDGQIRLCYGMATGLFLGDPQIAMPVPMFWQADAKCNIPSWKIH